MPIDPVSLPRGATPKMFGQDIMKWGSGNAAAIARIDSLTHEELLEWNITVEMVEWWRQFYVEALRKNPRNPSARGRIELMERAIELLSHR